MMVIFANRAAQWSMKLSFPKPEIVRTAHEIPLAGHLSKNKTRDKILRHFYWLGIRKDIFEHKHV